MTDPPPTWFGPAMQAALQPIQSRLDSIEIRLRNMEARQCNAVALQSDDPIMFLLNASGETPKHVPATRRDLHDLSDGTVKALLQFYHQSIPNDTIHRRQRLKQFLGIRN